MSRAPRRRKATTNTEKHYSFGVLRFDSAGEHYEMRPITTRKMELTRDDGLVAVFSLGDEKGRMTHESILDVFNSMTHKEYACPELLKEKSRVRRIARGSGIHLESVEELMDLVINLGDYERKTMWNWYSYNFTLNPTSEVYEKTLKPTLDNPELYERSMMQAASQVDTTRGGIQTEIFLTVINVLSVYNERGVYPPPDVKQDLDEKVLIPNPVARKVFHRHKVLDEHMSEEDMEKVNENVKGVMQKLSEHETEKRKLW